MRRSTVLPLSQRRRKGSWSALVVICFLVGALCSLFLPTQHAHAAGEQVNVWETTSDQANKIAQQGSINFSSGSSSNSPVITVDDTTRFQTMQGFGASFNDSSVYELEQRMSQSQRNALMTQLFDPTNGIGLSLLRQPVEGSDQNGPGSFCSYDDNGGTADPNLTNFSINYDITSGRIALLQQAQSLNSQLKVMATTWCVPQWMLQSTGGVYNEGTLQTQYYQTYANYLTKFVQAYAAQNIPIDALTPQNEPVPGVDFGDAITPAQEASLIANNLGPTFANNNIATHILGGDTDYTCCYAENLLSSSAALPYLYGIAYHGYNGGPTEMSSVHESYPNKATWFTEDSPPTNNTNWTQYMPVVASRSISILRNWASTYIQWTIASNPQFGPGGCSNCGALTYIDDTTGAATYSLDYYILGQYAKFVKVGAVRVDSNDTSSNGVYNVAFQNPDGSNALIVYNNNSSSQTFGVNWGNENFSYTLPSQGFATFTWSGSQQGIGPNLVRNASFELGDLTDWNVWVPSGQNTSNAFVETGGYNSTYRLVEYNATSAFAVSVYQCFSNISPGTYQASAWVEGSGNQDMAIYNQAGGTVLASVSTAPTDYNNWHQISLSVNITGGQPCIAFETNAAANDFLRVDDVSFTLQ